MNIPCNVIIDLIPLVKDGVASNESTEIVNKHVSSCESCKAELETFGSLIEEQIPINDENIINAIKGRLFIRQILILVVAVIIGIVLTYSKGMFFNYMIMPIIGGISLIALKRKWYLAPITIFILFGLHRSIIYTSLVILGVVITALLKYAFKKGNKMKSKNIMPLKILAGVIAIIIIVGMLFVINTFVALQYQSLRV